MKKTTLFLGLLLCLTACLFAQTPAPAPAAAPPAAPAAAPPPAPVAITDADIKNIAAPDPKARANGDPDGSLTGTVADVVVSDAKKGLTIADAVNQIGQNRVAINFVWTLVTGFLVMFMQAGFAVV